MQVDVLVQTGQLTTALETAERYKNRCLTRILDQWQEQVISPSHAEMRQLLRPQTAILYWHLSDDALTTFLLLPDQAQPQLLETDALRQRQRQFSQWQTDWNRDYRDYRDKKDEATDPASAKANHIWRRELPQRLSRLREILGIAAIEQQLAGLAQGITQLILVPHRDLHRFPIHALFSASFTCTYLPSLQIGLNLQTRSAIDLQTASLFSVADPQSNRDEMVYAQIESAVIQQFFTQVIALPPQQATKANVTEALRQPHNLFHFTGHGSHDDQNPQNSAIGLAHGETLTAQEISQIPLQTCYLASIAACETALTSRQSIDSEYVGLVSALLQAGTAHVLSTLWNVEADSAAFLVIYFYQQMLAGSPPALALHQAQAWLRTITNAELADWLSRLPPPPDALADRFNSRIRNLRIVPDTMSYQDPYYWAAFTMAGKISP